MKSLGTIMAQMKEDFIVIQLLHAMLGVRKIYSVPRKVFVQKEQGKGHKLHSLPRML